MQYKEHPTPKIANIRFLKNFSSEISTLSYEEQAFLNLQTIVGSRNSDISRCIT